MASYLPFTPTTFTPECEVFREGREDATDLFQNCKANPGHANFIPVSEFGVEHLPPEWQFEEMVDTIRYHCNLTVKITIYETSVHRPETYPESDKSYPYGNKKDNAFIIRTGTGEIVNPHPPDPIEGEPCPCWDCKDEESPRMKYWKFLVSTSTHVIYDDAEAAESIFDLFYDSEDRSDVKCLYGIGMWRPINEKVRTYTDKCVVEAVTHDLYLGAFLYDLRVKEPIVKSISPLRANHLSYGYGAMVSHPHGKAKHITIGKILKYTVLTGPKLPVNVPHRMDSALTCRLPLYPWSDFHTSRKCVTSVDETNTTQQTSEPNDKSLKMSKLHSKFIVEPGTEFTLPEGTCFTLPTDAKYAYTYANDEQGTQWLNFYAGTLLTTPEGDVLRFPPEAEFTTPDYLSFQDVFKHRRYRYTTHDIPSCPGSSGAGITFQTRSQDEERVYQHSGAVARGNKLCGLNFYFPIKAGDNSECGAVNKP